MNPIYIIYTTLDIILNIKYFGQAKSVWMKSSGVYY